MLRASLVAFNLQFRRDGGLLCREKRGLSLNHIAQTLSASETFVKKAVFRLYENKTRARKRSAKEKVKETKDMKELKQSASEMSCFMWRLTFCQLVMNADYFHRRNSCHSHC